MAPSFTGSITWCWPFLLSRCSCAWGPYGPSHWRYFRSGWNVFDFAIVAASLLPGLGNYAVAARLLRLLRVLRLIRTLPDLQIILGALLRSIPSIGYVLLLMLLLLYVYAVAGVFLFGPNDPFHFGNLHSALLTLFSILTLEGWVDVLRIQYFGCDALRAARSPACAASHRPNPWLSRAVHGLVRAARHAGVLELAGGHHRQQHGRDAQKPARAQSTPL
jgi:hypothetical protein